MTNGHDSRWQYLLERYFTGAISSEELDELLKLAGELKDEEQLSVLLKGHWEKAAEAAPAANLDLEARFAALFDRERRAAPVIPLPHKAGSGWYRVAAAVLILFAVSAGFYYMLGNERKSQPQVATKGLPAHQFANDLKPGTSGAMLTLPDGRQIDLDSAGNGVLRLPGKATAINTSGKITYQDLRIRAGGPLYNTIVTSKGKQYQVELSDGSKVWLNAASSIRFPIVFAGPERAVEVTGEVYFEVAKILDKANRRIPFIVRFNTPSGNNATVRVLGTHFNINTYGDETSAKTSLLEGSIQVSLQGGKASTLTPGQQAVIDRTGLVNVADDVDMDAVTAWKNGYFSFNKTDLPSLMRQIARWYNVDVQYDGAVPDRTFGGEISRNSNASQVLKILEESKVNFRVEGKKIIVSP